MTPEDCQHCDRRRKYINGKPVCAVHGLVDFRDECTFFKEASE